MKEQIFNVVSTIMNVEVEHINEDSSPDNIENWDSLKHMNLVVALEETFNIEFSPEDIGEMMSVGLIIAIVNKY